MHIISPAKDFGSVAAISITNGFSSESFVINGGIFCGFASVIATTILGFNSWDKILCIPDKKLTAILKRILCYIGGLITSAPLMLDTFEINQDVTPFVTNLIITILPGIFMSGVYGHSIEFLYNEFTKTNTVASNEAAKIQSNLALSIGIFLGMVSAIGCYWESLNALSPLMIPALGSNLPAYVLSALPVICRAPLFIVSAYLVTKKVLATVLKRETLSLPRLSLLIGITLFSIFTIGGYSDITYNGMTQSHLFQTSSIFHDLFYPLILGVAMLCMLLLNADALITAFDRVTKYFTKNDEMQSERKLQ